MFLQWSRRTPRNSWIAKRIIKKHLETTGRLRYSCPNRVVHRARFFVSENVTIPDGKKGLLLLVERLPPHAPPGQGRRAMASGTQMTIAQKRGAPESPKREREGEKGKAGMVTSFTAKSTYYPRDFAHARLFHRSLDCELDIARSCNQQP